jgi:ABC-type glycerol-3-phosphate transport system substrate-binding protein
VASGRVVRVYQEDWWPFRNLPAALRRFTERTGIAAELAWDKVGVGSIETMFDRMTRSFTDDDPPFDLVCADEVMLRRFAAGGRVLPLDDLMARDGVTLDDVTAATREAVTLGGEVLGLPCVNVSNMLLYRRDLLERHGLPVPQDWAELKRTAVALQVAVRREEGRPDFHGFATRGAGGDGHSVWTIGSFLASFGGRWLDRDGRPTALTPEAEAALGTYLDLLAAAAPPDQASISFVELMRDYRAGRAGMVLEVGMEHAHLFRDDPGLGARSGVALVPAGPAGRSANLYSPPWAIPRASKAREEAWELARFLTSRGQLLEDGLEAEAVEAASLPVLYHPGFDGHFRADLLAVARATRAIAAEERPWSTLGIGACEAVGDAVEAALRGKVTARGALERVQRGLEGLARHG